MAEPGPTAESKRDDMAARIRETMATEGGAVGQNTRVFNRGRYEAFDRFESYETARTEARAVKEDAIDRLPELIDELTESVEENGGTVFVAENGAEANDYIRSVAESVDADRLVKSKSMTTEEIEVNEALEAAGVDVVETDLGEWILQLADEDPSHLIAPAIHKTRSEIAALFADRFDLEEPLETAEELTRFAREQLATDIETADIGMTGANFVAADSGTLAVVTSEGNARKTVAAPPVHIAVTGIEKIVPSVESMTPFVELIGKAGTGQDLTAYVSFFTPPVPTPVPDFSNPDAPLEPPTDREFHLVLIDNGRSSMRSDADLRETLYCIRCSACSNSCGNFQSVGGHLFGGETYSGGIGTGWEAGIEGLDVAGSFNDLCTGCSRCVPACPVKIDIPWLNTVIRDRVNRHVNDRSAFDWLPQRLQPDAEPGGIPLGKRLVGNFDRFAKMGAKTTPVSNWIAGAGPVRVVLEAAAGIDRRRPLPRFAGETFRSWFADRGGSQVDRDSATREVVLYPDTSTNYFEPERGKAAVRVLEAAGIHVRVPAIPGSGRPPLSQGMIETARSRATAVAARLEPHLSAGCDVVVIEPSDVAMFRREYEKLLDPGPYERIRDRTYDIMEYVNGLLEAGLLEESSIGGPADASMGQVAYHPHCQGRTIGSDGPAVAVLTSAGFDVLTSDTECCGMAGSFGYKQEYYELSLDVGQPIADQFSGTGRQPVASGFSCQEHLDTLLGQSIPHPIELIDPERVAG